MQAWDGDSSDTALKDFVARNGKLDQLAAAASVYEFTARVADADNWPASPQRAVEPLSPPQLQRDLSPGSGADEVRELLLQSLLGTSLRQQAAILSSQDDTSAGRPTYGLVSASSRPPRGAAGSAAPPPKSPNSLGASPVPRTDAWESPIEAIDAPPASPKAKEKWKKRNLSATPCARAPVGPRQPAGEPAYVAVEAGK